MKPTPAEFIRAARVPHTLEPQTFGLWEIERREQFQAVEISGSPHPADIAVMRMRAAARLGSFDDYTLLRRFTLASMHLRQGEIVMEDSEFELRKHLPIWMAARGRVLKTGLGLGCVVRGLLLDPAVEHIDVVEIEADICRIVGAEFTGNPRVTIHCADALEWDFGDRRWDYAWHDLHSFDDRHLQLMHADLISRYMPAVRGYRQGAWAFPREIARRMPFRMIGAPRIRA